MVSEEIKTAHRLLADQISQPWDPSILLPGSNRSCAEGDYGAAATSHGWTTVEINEGINSLDTSSSKPQKCFSTDGASIDDLLQIVDLAEQSEGWAILLFQGIGVGELAIDASVHYDFCEILARRNLRVSPVAAIAASIRGSQPKHAARNW